jgi:hypothetical protein
MSAPIAVLYAIPAAPLGCSWWTTAKTEAHPQAPTARPIPAWGEAPCMTRHKNRGLKARPIPLSIPEIPLVDIHAILPQKRQKLFLKCLFPMVHFLSIDISDQRLQIGRPNRENPISSLPGKLREPLGLQPSGRRTLQLFNQLRDVCRARQPNRKMHMILDTSNAIAFAIGIARNGGKITEERRAYRGVKHRSPLLCAEDHMNENVRKRQRHSANYRPAPQPSYIRNAPPSPHAPLLETMEAE